MKKFFEGIIKRRKNPWEIVLILIIFSFFLVNASYVSYLDEFVNLLGGKTILEGGIPYKHFFDHHLPFAWYLSAFLQLFSFGSFYLFRLAWAVFTFIVLYLLCRWISARYKELHSYYLVFFTMYPLMGVYFWFHLFLSDSLAVLFFSLIFWILIVQTISKRISYRAILFSSFLTFILIFSSLTFLYAAFVFYAWQVYLIGLNWRKLLKYAALVVTPYAIYFLYLLVTGSFTDFYFANVTYNTSLYISIPNYVKGRLFNPLKFALTLIFNFHSNYVVLLTKIKHLDLFLPIGVLAGLGTLVLFLALIPVNLIVAFIFFLLLSFSAPRSNIQNYAETDYQSSVFLVLGVMSSLIAFYLLKKAKFQEEVLEDIKRVVQVLLVIFFFFSFVFLLKNTYDKYFLRYTQKMPSVEDVAYTADFVDDIVELGDYYWVGPFEPLEEFFVKIGKLPGKYPTLLPQFRESEYLRNSFIKQFEENKPVFIIYKHEASIFGTPSLEFGKFFTDWMSDKYTSIENIEGVQVKNSPSSFNMSTDLYLLNEKQDELLKRLKERGYTE